MKIERPLIALSFLLVAGLAFGQDDKPQASDRSHFGFFLGIDLNTSQVALRNAEDVPIGLRDSVSSVSSRPRPGAHIGVSFEHKLGAHTGFRALAGLSFTENALQFGYAHGGSERVSFETARLDLHPQLIWFQRSPSEGFYCAVGPSVAYDVDEASVLRRTTFAMAGAIGWRTNVCGLFSIAPELSFAHSLNSSIEQRTSVYTGTIDDLRINTVSLRLCFQ